MTAQNEESDKEISEIINELHEWSSAMFLDEMRGLDGTDFCSTSFYVQEKKRIHDDSSKRHKLIGKIESMLLVAQKSA